MSEPRIESIDSSAPTHPEPALDHNVIYFSLAKNLAARMSEPFDDRGAYTEYPAFWVAQMSKTSNAFEQLLRARALYPRIKQVLGEQWIERNDPRNHSEMEEFALGR